MKDYLVFTLAAPFSSFGSVAGNERRGTLPHPGHSMLVGLLAAALGIRREEEDRLGALSDACRFGVKICKPGNLMVDYHTVQSAKRKKNFAPTTRRQMLDEGERTTILTRREYLVDTHFTIAVDVVASTVTIDDLSQALRGPHFVLYAGRKACTLGLPPNPQTISAASIDESFAQYDQLTENAASIFWTGTLDESNVIVDARLKDANTPGIRQRRRSKPIDRGTWRFDTLDELVLSPRPAPDPREKDDT
ncbi:MAG: type I-E CRISPR-associated protein Cas5/CasD [Hyphomicrobiaceae bacterium]